MKHLLGTVIGALLVLSACSAPADEAAPVVPLLPNPEETATRIYETSGDALQEAFDMLFAGLLRHTPDGAWTKDAMDSMQEDTELVGIALLGPDSQLKTRRFPVTTGDFATSVLFSRESVLFSLHGESEVCWAMRVSGTPSSPTVQYSEIASDTCTAAEFTNPETTWSANGPGRVGGD